MMTINCTARHNDDFRDKKFNYFQLEKVHFNCQSRDINVAHVQLKGVLTCCYPRGKVLVKFEALQMSRKHQVHINGGYTIYPW